MRWGFIWGLCLFPFLTIAQDYNNTYEELMMTGQQTKIPALFELWEQETPDDENLYITAFNHYMTIAREQRIIRPTETDSTSSEGDTFVSSEVMFNDSLFNISQSFINKGIKKNPRRLDMHFGKIHALWLKGNHRDQTSEILGLINLGDKLKHDWLWSGNEQPEDSKQLFTSSIYQYVENLYTSNRVDYVQQISERMIQSFPKEIANYSNLGAAFLMKADYKNALKYFKKAYKLDKKDIIVLNNLGHTYDMKEKYPKAIKYYELIKEYGSEDERDFAQEKINDIKLRMNL